MNQKVVRRLHRLWDLALLRRVQPPPPSGVRQVLTKAGSRINLVRPGLQIDPLGLFYTDFTELVYGGGKAWLMTILDHVTKVAPGWAVSSSADTVLALQAWRRARLWLRRRGVPVRGVIVHHDRDPVYTGYRWLRELLVRDQVRVSFALNGCRDNTEMEAFHSRFKSENRSLVLDAQTPADLTAVVNQRMRYYNGRRRHSALGNQAPLVFLASLFPQS